MLVTRPHKYYYLIFSILFLLPANSYSKTLDGLNINSPEKKSAVKKQKTSLKIKEIKLNPTNNYLRNAEKISLPITKKIEINNDKKKVALHITPPSSNTHLWSLKLSTNNEAAIVGELRTFQFDEHKRVIATRLLTRVNKLGSISLSSLVWPDKPVYLLISTLPFKNAELNIQAQKTLPKLERKDYSDAFHVLSEAVIKETINIPWKVRDKSLQKLPWLLKLNSAFGTRYSVQIKRKGRVVVRGETDENSQLVIKNWRPAKNSFELEIKPLDKQVSAISLSLEPIKNTQATLEKELERFTPVTFNKKMLGSLSHKVYKRMVDNDIWQIDLSKAHSLSHIKLSLTSENPTHQLKISLKARGAYNNIINLEQRGEINLESLSLKSDKYKLEVSSKDVGVEYTLQVEKTVAPSKIQEHEPNDSETYATTIIARRPMKGKLSQLDKKDYFKLDTSASGEAQLWRFIATGKGVESITLDKKYTARLNPRANAQPISFKHILLLPGVHYLKLMGDGAYTLRAIPLGAPKAGFEVEPNDGKYGPLQRLNLGEKITGSLDHINYGLSLDEDKYRFTVKEQGKYKVTITPPEDQGIQVKLNMYSYTWFDADLITEAATPLVYESGLLPADYTLTIKNIAKQYALDEYSVLLEKIENKKIEINADIEPNDRHGFGSFIFESKVIKGTLGNFDKIDHFILPASDNETLIKLLDENKDKKFLAKLFTDKGILMSRYSGYQLKGNNTWIIKPHKKDISFALQLTKIRPNKLLNYQLDIKITPKFSSKKNYTKGIKTLPKQLKDKINIAWSGLGATWQLTAKNKLNDSGSQRALTSLATLNDNLMPHGRGGEWKKHDLPEYFHLKLATNKAINIEGIALNTRMVEYPEYKIRRFDFLISKDGETFDYLFSGELDSSHRTQYFTFEKPITAKYVQLIPSHNFTGRKVPIKFKAQELQVFASRDFKLKNKDLASQPLGGHIVYQTFFDVKKQLINALDKVLLDGNKGEKEQLSCQFDKKQKQAEWVIGFHHNRKAQIQSLKYLTTQKKSSLKHFDQLTVQTSSKSPLGPWKTIGKWSKEQLSTHQDINFPDEPWVQFVRFIATGKEKQSYLCPDDIIIIEKQNTGDYQSILAEWGGDTPFAIYEQFHTAIKTDYSPAGGANKEDAISIDTQQIIHSSVKRERNEDWFVLDKAINKSKNSLKVIVSHPKSFKPYVHLFDDKGKALQAQTETTNKKEMVVTDKSLPIDWTKTPYLFSLTSSKYYYLRIQEPPRSSVIAWDSSGSMGSHLPYIHSSIQAWADYIQPEHEQVKILTFKGSAQPKKNWANYPYMLQAALELVRNKPTTSSDAEYTLRQSSQLLSPQQGNHAVVITTDSISAKNTEFWAGLKTECPQIYGAGISGGAVDFANLSDSDFDKWQDTFQNWVSACGGKYQYCDSFQCLEDFYAFAAADIRKPKPYHLNIEAIYKKPLTPGSISVSVKKQALKKIAKALYVILDASGSMLKKIDGKYRIDIAKKTLKTLVAKSIGDHNHFGLRTFGLKSKKCHHELTLPVKKLNSKQAQKAIDKIRAISWAKTPIADSLTAAADDLKGFKGEKLIILLTDGKETCGGDSESVLRSLRASGLDIKMYIVGLALDDKKLVEQFQKWASLGGGKYYDAQNQSELQSALNKAVTPRFEVKNNIGEVVLNGFVGDKKTELPVGRYTITLPEYPQIKEITLDVISGKDTLIEFY